MAKKSTKTKSKGTIVVSLSDFARAASKIKSDEQDSGRTISVLEAQLKDGFCHYSYEIITGQGAGFVHKVKGTGIIEDDMRSAFNLLNVHLAFIDDVYKHSGIKFPDIDKMHNDDLALLYEVTGFKIRGSDENEDVILIGSKHLSAGSRMELESPKIPLDNLSSYKWYNELKESISKCREEVALYHYGKYTPVKEEEASEESSGVQLIIGHEAIDEELESAKV